MDGRAAGQTDRHDEADTCFSLFCEGAKKNACIIPLYNWLTRPYVRAVAPHVFDIDFVTF